MKHWLIFLLVYAALAPAWAQDGRPTRINRPLAGVPQMGGAVGDTANLAAMDSGRTIYGAYSTQVFTETDWLEERRGKLQVDTVLQAIHRYSYPARTGYLLQDLTFFASPATNIYYEQPGQIGLRMGTNALQHLLSDELLYFDTKSPYTSWHYVQGGSRRSLLDIVFARNVTPRSNVGLGYQRFISGLLTGTQLESRGQRQGDFQNIRLQGNYASKSGKYRVLGQFNNYRHILSETGGLVYDADLPNLEVLFSQSEGLWRNRLATATGGQKGSKLHIYHELRPIGRDSAGFSFFQQIEWMEQANTYADSRLAVDDTLMYPNIFLNAEATAHEFRLQQWDVRTGIKVHYEGLFLMAYMRQRLARAGHEAQDLYRLPYRTPLQQMIGAIGYYNWEGVGKLRFEAEHWLGRDYRLDGLLWSKWFEAFFKQAFYSPSLLEQRYYGNHFQWRNNFANTLATELGGALKFGNKYWQLKPNIRLGNVGNLVYFGEGLMPIQAARGVSFVMAGLEAKLSWKVWNFRASGRYAESTDALQMPLPRFHANAMAYYENIWLKGALPIQLGVDFHWHSAYYANAYHPVLQQFYRQRLYRVGNYPLAEVFVAGTVRTVRIFAKFTNVLEGLLLKGYYLTPGYMSQPRQFEFGINWKFYD